MRSASNNPFLPGSDRVPEVWAGRREELADFHDVVLPRRGAGLYERGRAVLGEFGIGKSVLVNKIAADAKDAGHWVPDRVRVAVGADVLGLLATALRSFVETRSLAAKIGREGTSLLSRVEELSLAVVGGGVRLRAADHDPNAYRAIAELMVELGRLAIEKDRIVVIRIDEVQNIGRPGPLSQVLTAVGDALEAVVSERDAAGIERDRALPLVVYLSGLPDFDRHVGESGATFSRRFRIADLGPLSDGDLRAALHPFASDGWPILTAEGPARVHMTPGALDSIVKRCLGDPFLFQLAGEAAWNAGTGQIITEEEAQRGWASARREVERYVSRRLDGLTDLQVEFLRTAASLPEDRRTATAIAKAMGRDSAATVASTVRALETGHAVIRREAGAISFRSRAVEAYLAGDWAI